MLKIQFILNDQSSTVIQKTAVWRQRLLYSRITAHGLATISRNMTWTSQAFRRAEAERLSLYFQWGGVRKCQCVRIQQLKLVSVYMHKQLATEYQTLGQDTLVCFKEINAGETTVSYRFPLLNLSWSQRRWSIEVWKGHWVRFVCTHRQICLSTTVRQISTWCQDRAAISVLFCSAAFNPNL